MGMGPIMIMPAPRMLPLLLLPLKAKTIAATITIIPIITRTMPSA
jgi:hypothetical protein